VSSEDVIIKVSCGWIIIERI